MVSVLCICFCCSNQTINKKKKQKHTFNKCIQIYIFLKNYLQVQKIHFHLAPAVDDYGLVVR